MPITCHDQVIKFNRHSLCSFVDPMSKSLTEYNTSARRVGWQITYANRFANNCLNYLTIGTPKQVDDFLTHAT